jgi:hypothetical protein
VTPEGRLALIMQRVAEKFRVGEQEPKPLAIVSSSLAT